MVKYLLSVWDYVVFAATILISVAIGVFFAFRSKTQTTEDYLLGGRQLPWFPVALSMTTSFMSAIIILGTPSEVYYYGTMYWWTGLTYLIMSIVTIVVFIPVFCNLNLTSCYRYLEMRFNKTVKISGTVAYLVQTTLYLGLVTYLPALALNQVTSLSLWGSLLATGAACILYSVIGGIKGIITADCFQLCVMLAGLIAIISKGSADVGGFGNVISIAGEEGTIIYGDTSLDPRVRHTVWSLLVGGTVTWVSNYGIGQSQVQRYLTCRSPRDATIAVFVNCIFLNVILALVMLVGLICVAHFRGCDPLLTDEISRADQMVPLMALQKFSNAPGINGLIISAAYSGTLSSVSTGIHSMACVVLEDFIRPVFPGLSEKTMTFVSKILTLLFGVLTLLIAFFASKLSFILQAALSVWGVVGGPLVGVFTLGVVFPFANAKGALLGQVIGFAVTAWIAVGSQIYKENNNFTNRLVTTTEFCLNVNNTDITLTTLQVQTVTHSSQEVTEPELPEMYFLSYLYYAVLATFVTVTVGLVTSAVTGYAKTKDELLCPPVRVLRKRFFGDSNIESSVRLEKKGPDDCECASDFDGETTVVKRKEETSLLLNQGSVEETQNGQNGNISQNKLMV